MQYVLIVSIEGCEDGTSLATAVGDDDGISDGKLEGAVEFIMVTIIDGESDGEVVVCDTVG